jgi:hypothetical protein
LGLALEPRDFDLSAAGSTLRMSLVPTRPASTQPPSPARRIVQEGLVAEPKLKAARESQREVKGDSCPLGVRPAAIRTPDWFPGQHRASNRKSRRR